MTASALASPALSESSLSDAYCKAQTSDPQGQSALPSPLSPSVVSLSSSSPSPSPLLPIHNSFTPSPDHQHHHLQILGNHPVSPVACSFLELAEDPFGSARGNLLFDADYRQDYSEQVYENEAFLPYTTSPSTPEDCQISTEYGYSTRSKNELTGEQFANSIASVSPAIGASFIVSESSAVSMPFDPLSSHLALNQATSGTVRDLGFQSSLAYAGQVVYNDDYYVSAQQHNMYSQQQSQGQYHSHSYSTNPLSAISEDSPLSRSFPGTSSMSSLGATYPLARTMSEPSIPFLQAMGAANGSASGAISANGAAAAGASLVRPTPKRSRGRRVSCNPDITGCKVFTCRFEDCGKVFKRSEHLKRHVRSIHTMEKPFECPIHNCPKRFSRSDNLNQHIRIHRHNGREKNKSFASFPSFLQNYPAELLTMS